MKLLLLASLMGLFAPLLTLAQSPNTSSEEGDVVRVTHHPDGSRSIYKRQRGGSGMLSVTYTTDGRLAVIHEYIEGKYGQLVGCNIYNNKHLVVYKVAYGYDRNARLIEERMFTNPGKKLVQRVIYKYDADGNRSKPIVVSLSTSEHKSDRLTRPTMEVDVNKIHQESKPKSR